MDPDVEGPLMGTLIKWRTPKVDLGWKGSGDADERGDFLVNSDVRGPLMAVLLERGTPKVDTSCP